MTEHCIYIMVSTLLVLIVVIYGLCRKVDNVDRKLDDFTETGDKLKKFGNNLEALFKTERKKG